MWRFDSRGAQLMHPEVGIRGGGVSPDSSVVKEQVNVPGGLAQREGSPPRLSQQPIWIPEVRNARVRRLACGIDCVKAAVGPEHGDPYNVDDDT